MTAPSEDLVDRLLRAATECKSLLREVHGATKDLRAAIREGEEMRAKFEVEFPEWLAGLWTSAEGADLLGKVREMYDHWFDVTGTVNKTMDRLDLIERRMVRRAAQMGA